MASVSINTTTLPSVYGGYTITITGRVGSGKGLRFEGSTRSRRLNPVFSTSPLDFCKPDEKRERTRATFPTNFSLTLLCPTLLRLCLQMLVKLHQKSFPKRKKADKHKSFLQQQHAERHLCMISSLIWRKFLLWFPSLTLYNFLCSWNKGCLPRRERMYVHM